jgi:hypothetical protein
MLVNKVPTCVIRASLFAGAMLLVAAPVWGRAKTDVVRLVNGDLITGEIKQLHRGLLKLSTDAMKTVDIEWDDIETLTTRYYFEVEDKDGYKYYGTPELTEEGEVRVTRANAVVTIEKLQVIRITPIEESFWSRINGSVSLGVSYTKGSQVGRIDIALEARYRVEKNYVELIGSSNVTNDATRDSASTYQRYDVTLTYQHLFVRRAFSDVSSSAFRNDEQGIAFRGNLAAGLGVNIIQSHSHVVLSSLGLSVNREFPTDPTAVITNNLEGVISLSYTVFKYDTPKTSLTSNATGYPRLLPNTDRMRVDVDAALSQEIIKDFTLVLTFYYNFNSKPPSEEASKDDYGFTTSIGYKY